MKRSIIRIVVAGLSVKRWMEFAGGVPPVDLVRPEHCSACGCAARPAGSALVVHGHGKRERQIRGPLEPGERPVLMSLLVRRYLCTACGVTMTVVPRGVLGRMYFLVGAIGMALALWALCRQPSHEVRSRVSPERHAGPDWWPSVFRWARSAERLLGRRIGAGRPRDLAAAIASVLLGHAPAGARGSPVEQRAYLGAVVAMR